MVIRFAYETQYGTFSDALSLPENIVYTNDEIESMKQARLDAWLAIVSAPPPEEA